MPISGNPYRSLESKIPGILKVYNTSNFTLQLKARVFFNICIAAIFALLILIASSTYVQLHGPDNKLNYQILIPTVVLLIVFIVSLLLLIKGKFDIASHLFLISANICVWYIMFFSKAGHIVIKFDTIVIVLAIINSIPLFIHKYKSTIIIYIVVNLLLLLFFVNSFKNDYGLTNFIIVDYLVDTSIAILFSGVAAYQIVRINNKALNKVEADYLKRIQAEKALKESEDFRKTIFENSTIPIVVMDSKTLEYIDLNDAAVKVFGFDYKEHILGKTPIELSPLNQNDGTSSKIKAMDYMEKVKNEGAVRFEWLHQKPNGELWDAEVHLLSFELDNKLFYQFSIIDITERKEAEKSLKESQQQFETLAKMSPVGIFRTRPDGYTYYVNPKWCELSGLSFDDAMGDGWLKAVYPDDIEFLIKNWNSALTDGEKSIAEYRFLKPDGNITWVLGNAIPEKINGELKGYIGTITNITEIKNVQEKINDSEKKFRDMADLLPVVVWEADLTGMISYTNKLGHELTGYDQNDLKSGINLMSIIIADDRSRASDNLKRILKGEKILGEEYTGLRKNGSVFPIRIYTSVIYKNDLPDGLRGVIVDITSIKDAEKELKESEDQLKMALQGAKLGMWDWDMQKNIITVNDLFVEMLGYQLNEFPEGILTFDDWKKMLHQDDFNKAMKLFNKHVEQKTELYEAVFRMKHKNGDWKWILARGKVLEWNNDAPVRALGTHLDITINKRAQIELKESEEKYREMAELLPIAIWETNLEGVCTYTNKVGLDIHGYTFNDLVLGINVLDLIIPEEKDKALKGLKNRIKGKLTKGEEYTAVKKDGTKFPARIYTSVIYKNNKPIGFRGVTVDITEAKKAEKQLKESEEKYRTIIEAFPDIIMISDLKGNIIFGNSALEKITGITPKDYNNPNRKAHIHPDDLHIIQDATNDLLEGNQVHTDIIENRFIDMWGNSHWFSGIISKLVINNEIYLQTISRDITDKKQIEQELEKYREHLESLVQERTEELAAANEELTSTNEELLNQRQELEAVLLNLQNTQKQLVQSEKMASLGVLASGIAHEINNPLNFIKGGVFGIESYLKENLEEHIDELNPLLDGINEGICRASDIVKSLNHYNRREDTKMVETDIHSIIDNCLVMLKNQIRNRIEVEKNYTLTKYELLGNEGKLHQVILNILSNAVQAIDKKGTIKIRTFVKGKQFRLQVKDSGCGISEENLDKILDPFFTTKEPGKGTGLGLSITHNILQEHNGSIEFNSKQNKGTTVLITLPLKDRNDG